MDPERKFQIILGILSTLITGAAFIACLAWGCLSILTGRWRRD
jgi:uncharacterized membrane protein YjjB (DUF3815 family)